MADKRHQTPDFPRREDVSESGHVSLPQPNAPEHFSGRIGSILFIPERAYLRIGFISGHASASASVLCKGLILFLTGWKCQPEGEDIGSGCCGGGVIQLRSRERALLRQGQLFEPLASSGPAAMVLAISRNLSCIPRRSPCPGRYPLPLASAFPSTSWRHSCIPRRSPCPSRYPLPPGVRLSIHLMET